MKEAESQAKWIQAYLYQPLYSPDDLGPAAPHSAFLLFKIREWVQNLISKALPVPLFSGVSNSITEPSSVPSYSCESHRSACASSQVDLMTLPVFPVPCILKRSLGMPLLLMVNFSCQRALGAGEEMKQTFAECLCLLHKCSLIIFAEVDTPIPVLQARKLDLTADK